MGRAEMRRAQRDSQKNQKTYTLTQDQINKLKSDATTEAVDKAFLLMLAIPVRVLHDKWWEKSASKRCPKFVDQCLDLYDNYNKGYVELEDLVNTMFEESGIRIERSDNPEKYY